MNNIIHLSDGEFKELVLESDLPVVVDFWAPWCSPCRMIAPVLEEIAQENEGRVLVVKVNTDEHQEWAMNFGIQGIPTLLFIAGGEIRDRQVGAGSPQALKARVGAFIEKSMAISQISGNSDG
ncbi:MAG: thioredoxin [Chloroflexota bacterium]|nr:MAG: thioredoxin [Chloroflexota bacterium]